MTWLMPLTDIRMTNEDIEAVLECLRSGWLTMGPRVQAFERAFAEYVGIEHAVAVSSGTAALHLAALATGVGPGDEVIVPSFSFVADAAVPRYCGATPVLCDSIGPRDFNLDPEDIRMRLTERTRAVMGVSFMGYGADVDALRALCDEHGLRLIEDACQSIGARAKSGRRIGTVGDVGAFSLFSKKQLCVGEGGMVVTSDGDLATNVRLLRSHAMTSVTWDRHQGYAEGYDVVDIGFNFRMDEPRAALGLSRLARLDDDIAHRRALVRQYREQLRGLTDVELPWQDEDVEQSSHFAFPIVLADRGTRDRLRDGLAALGVQTTVYPAIGELGAYGCDGRSSALPRAADIAHRHCALPLSSNMSGDDVRAVVGAVVSVLDATRELTTS
jgi:dTDP-4-amino-4,6-dideoxygalactose transaminase